MNKYIFDDIVYEDLDIYNTIIKEYNIELYEYNIYTENILNQIYLLKIDINKQKNLIEKINIKISSLKNKFINNTLQWTLNDSCNKKNVKEKVKHILEIHNIISQLKYDKEDIEKIIENNINNINTKLTDLNNKSDTVSNIKNSNNEYDYDDYDDYDNDDNDDDEFNSIING